MNTRITALLIIFILTSMLHPAYALGSGTSACGDIHMKNGERFDSVKFEMPLNQDTQVKVTINGNKRKIKADSIDYIELWHVKHPDMKYVIKPYYQEYMNTETGENQGVADYLLWMCCELEGPHASYLHRIGRPDFKKGRLRFNYNALHSYQSTRYVLKRGSHHPCLIPASTKDKKKWIRVYFNDDPEVMRRFESGEYDFSDFGYKSVDIYKIVEDYNPGR